MSPGLCVKNSEWKDNSQPLGVMGTKCVVIEESQRGCKLRMTPWSNKYEKAEVQDNWSSIEIKG